MAKLTLTDIENLNNENSVITAINNNSAAIETALENTLSRNGTSPNTMSAQLDMNSNKIVNVGTPTTSTDAVRLHELTDAESTIGGYAANAANSATAAATSASSAASSAIGASSSASAASASASNAATFASNAASSASNAASSATSASNSATAAQGYAASAATLVSDGDKGDVVISSSGTVYTVDNNVITYAKIQNVSATDKLLGRSSAGAGVVEEITCTSYGRALIDDTSTSAQRTTLGLGGLAVLSNITSSYVTDFNESVDDRVSSLLQAGPNITLTYNDTLNTLTIAAAGTGGGATISDGDYTDVAVSSSGTVFKVESAAGNFDVTGTTALHAGIVVGSSYAGAYSAPANGSIIEGSVGIGLPNPGQKLDVAGTARLGSNGSDYIQISGGTTWTTISSTGSSTNTGINFNTKGNGGYFFYNGSGIAFAVSPIAAPENYLQFGASVGGNDPNVSVQSSVNTNVGLRFTTKGTGSFYISTNGSDKLKMDGSTGNTRFGSGNPSCTVDIAGNFGRGAPVTKTGNFTWATTENWIIVNNSGGSTTVTLPTASSFSGRELMVHTTQAQTVVSASSNVVPLTGGAAGTAILAATAGKWAQLVSDGTNWIITQAG